MKDFQLQTEINDFTRQQIDLFSEKRKLEAEIENQTKIIKITLEKNLTSAGIFTLALGVWSFIFNDTFDYFFLFIFGILNLIEFIFLFAVLYRKKQNLETWTETPQELSK